jgi:general stress protein 26
MAGNEPVPELDERFGDGTEPMAWVEVERVLTDAEIFWITTTKADGQPHVTPLMSVRLDDAQWFCTGPDEQKGKNLQRQALCNLLTGSNAYDEGLDVAIEGEAVRTEDEGVLRRLAAAWHEKYGDDWQFDVAHGAFLNEEGGPAWVYEVRPSKVLAFTRGVATQTRFRFDRS